jgi:hypothetical protein
VYNAVSTGGGGVPERGGVARMGEGVHVGEGARGRVVTPERGVARGGGLREGVSRGGGDC